MIIHKQVLQEMFILTHTSLTAKKLWRIDLGKNIRAGAHYTQFLVYDFDMDGKRKLPAKRLQVQLTVRENTLPKQAALKKSEMPTTIPSAT